MRTDAKKPWQKDDRGAVIINNFQKKFDILDSNEENNIKPHKNCIYTIKNIIKSIFLV